MIKQICNGEIIDYIKPLAKAEGILFPKKAAYYFGYYIDYKIVGIAAIVMTRTTAKLKCSFVMKEHRGKGIATKLLKYRLDFLEASRLSTRFKCRKIITANCTKMSVGLHIKAGAKVVEKYKNGITKVSYENI